MEIPAIDLWALGCIIYEMITGIKPFDGATKKDVMENIINRDIDISGAKISENAKDLIDKLLNVEPYLRLGAGQKGTQQDYESLKSHPWFANMKGAGKDSRRNIKVPFDEFYRLEIPLEFEPTLITGTRSQKDKYAIQLKKQASLGLSHTELAANPDDLSKRASPIGAASRGESFAGQFEEDALGRSYGPSVYAGDTRLPTDDDSIVSANGFELDLLQQQSVKVELQCIFYKLGGGALGRQKQKRTLKLHQNGHITYWKESKKAKGLLVINAQTDVGLHLEKSRYNFYVNTGGRRYEFEDVSKNENNVAKWVDLLKQIVQDKIKNS